jgi:carboxyl-terminal processing protease
MKLLLALMLAITGVARAQDEVEPRWGALGPLRIMDELEATPGEVFLEAWRVTRSAFYDPKMHGVDWAAVRDELMPRAEAAGTAEALSEVINDALGRLKASHTRHYHAGQREYYELLDVFFPEGVPRRAGLRIRPGPVRYVGIGLATATVEGRVYAADVYEGGPAAEAGILTGDELLGVEDGAWGDIAPFADREGLDTRILIQRTRDPESRRELVVVPRVIRPRQLFLESIKRSARFIEHDGQRVAYIRVRSYAHPSYHDAVRDILETTFTLAAVEEPGLPLIVDLRGGGGGAQARYMDIFNPVAPEMVMIGREGERMAVRAAWPVKTNPVVMLVDEGSRSGKEVLAHAFKVNRVGTLVGRRTAGAVLAGSARPLADGSLLYVAVADVLVDGNRLEGVGVEPDVLVDRGLPYSAGRDPQLEAAVGFLLKE